MTRRRACGLHGPVPMVKGRRRWPWIVLGCVAIVAALLLIAQDQETVRVRSPLDARNPQFTPYVASLVGVPVSDGNAYQMLLNGDAIFPAMLQAIAKAEHRISFESFIYSGRRSRAAVHVGADRSRPARRHGSHRPRLDWRRWICRRRRVKELTDAGMQVVWFNPLASWSIEEVNYRTHRKVLVVDGDVAFTGGVGVADHWRRQRAGARALARHAVPRDRSGGARARSRRSTRTGSSRAAARRRRSIPTTRIAVDRRASVVVWSNPMAAPATSSCSTCCRLPAPAAVDRHPVAVLRPRRLDAWALDASPAARRPHPHADRGRHHRREAGEGRQPLRLRRAARPGLRDLRVPADDDARQGDGRGRRWSA